MKTLAAIFALAFSTAHAAGPVVRPAPDFAFARAGTVNSLRALRGQPVVLLVAKNPESRAFRKQVKAIEQVYRELASRSAVFAVAFSESGEGVASDVPFVVVANGAAVAKAYGLNGDFMLGVVGPDGNLDLTTGEVTRGLRIREVILNSFAVQMTARREKPKGPPSIAP